LSLERKHAVLLEKSVVSNPSEQPTITWYTYLQKKYTPTDTSQKELNDTLVSHIAGDLLALFTVDSEHLQEQ